MWYKDDILLNERAAIFREWVGEDIRRVIKPVPEDRLDNYQFLREKVTCHFK